MSDTKYRYLNYKADVTEGIVGKVMGPTPRGELLKVVDAEYDGTRTRVRFEVLEGPQHG